MIDSLIENLTIDKSKLIGIGICAPGPMDTKNGILLAPSNLPEVPHIPLRQIFESHFNLPTFLELEPMLVPSLKNILVMCRM